MTPLVLPQLLLNLAVTIVCKLSLLHPFSWIRCAGDDKSWLCLGGLAIVAPLVLFQPQQQRSTAAAADVSLHAVLDFREGGMRLHSFSPGQR